MTLFVVLGLLWAPIFGAMMTVGDRLGAYESAEGPAMSHVVMVEEARSTSSVAIYSK